MGAQRSNKFRIWINWAQKVYRSCRFKKNKTFPLKAIITSEIKTLHKKPWHTWCWCTDECGKRFQRWRVGHSRWSPPDKRPERSRSQEPDRDKKHQSGEHPSGFIHTRNKQKTECSTNEQFLVPLCQIQGLLFSKEITTFLPRKITTLTLQCWKGAYIQSIIIPPHGSHTWCAGKYFLWFRSSATGYSNLHIKISQWKPSK